MESTGPGSARPNLIILEVCVEYPCCMLHDSHQECFCYTGADFRYTLAEAASVMGIVRGVLKQGGGVSHLDDFNCFA